MNTVLQGNNLHIIQCPLGLLQSSKHHGISTDTVFQMATVMHILSSLLQLHVLWKRINTLISTLPILR